MEALVVVACHCYTHSGWCSEFICLEFGLNKSWMFTIIYYGAGTVKKSSALVVLKITRSVS